MNKIFFQLDRVYRAKGFKAIFRYSLTTLAICTYVVVPMLVKRHQVILSIGFDLLIRIFIASSLAYAFWYISDLRKTSELFYRGAPIINAAKPSSFKQIINVILTLAFGTVMYLFTFWSISFFIPSIGLGAHILAMINSVSVIIPLLSQYNKY